MNYSWENSQVLRDFFQVDNLILCYIIRFLKESQTKQYIFMVTYSVNQKTYPTNRFLPVNNSVLVQPTEFLPPPNIYQGRILPYSGLRQFCANVFRRAFRDLCVRNKVFCTMCLKSVTNINPKCVTVARNVFFHNQNLILYKHYIINIFV